MHTGQTGKFIIFTWGCQMNEDDSEQIAARLTQMGYRSTNNAQEADIAILVTCSVRAKPEEKAKSKLGELRILKASRPEMIIGVYGCMAQRKGDSLKRNRPYLDFVAGTACVERIPELIDQIKERRRYASALEMPIDPCGDRPIPNRVLRTESALRRFVTVMYGCDNFCSYCIVPHVRGRERSRPLQDIIDEVRALVDNGCREVTLLGQNVNSYGATLDGRVDFADLLRAVSAVDGIDRIRFTTSHPKDLSDRLIEAIATTPEVCEHLHLAVQSGDDEVLQRMNRRYTASHFIERVSALREAVPDIAITTDFLVGFPGETEEQFENTLRFAETVRFDAAFMFAYNAITGTASARMRDILTKREKNARLERLIRVQNAITCEINASETAKLYEVLVDGVSPRDPSRLTGLTRQHKTVNFEGDKELVGNLITIRPTEAHLYGFVGEVIAPVACP